VARSGERPPWRTKPGRGDPGRGAGAQSGGAKGGQNPLFRQKARRGSVIGMCFGVPGPQGGRRCAGDDDVSPAMANRRPAGAERIASRTARSTWGWQRPREGVGESAGLRRLSPAYALLRRRNAGFGRRERRRRRCGGQRVSSGERGKSPIRVNRGLLGRTRPRRGQQLFTCKRRDAREASLPLRCYAESREGPGLHRQPRPGDRRCVGRPPSASAEAGL
jgi:hypothetical protein